MPVTMYAVSRPEGPFAVAMAVGAALGAAGAAMAGVQAAQDGLPDLPDVSAVTADLGLDGASVPDVVPVTPAAPTATASTPAASPAADVAKARSLAAHDAKVDAAIDRFESFIGSTRYEHYCERAVENAYGTQSNFSSALSNWHSSDQHTDWRNAPRGALVFYDTSSNGHVAVSLGDGRVISSSAHNRVGIVPIDYFQEPLGWAPSPF